MDPYAQIPRYYDAEFESVSVDIALLGRISGEGPLLVLGCGPGRFCRAYEAQRPVIGLDRSLPMLEVARSRPGPGGPFGHTRYVEGDLTTFDVGRVGEILMPNAVFAFLPTREAQAACLAACARALPVGGGLLIDLPMPDFARLGAAHTEEKPAWEGEVDGRLVARTREVRRYPIGQRLELHDRFYVAGERVAEALLPLRIVYPAELEWILEAAGFYVDASYGDYAGRPLHEGCPRLIARAVKL